MECYVAVKPMEDYAAPTAETYGGVAELSESTDDGGYGGNRYNEQSLSAVTRPPMDARADSQDQSALHTLHGHHFCSRTRERAGMRNRELSSA